LEDVNHLFILCNFFIQIWSGVFNWSGLFVIKLARVSDHLIQLVALGSFSNYIMSVMLLIFLSTVWIIWRERNA